MVLDHTMPVSRSRKVLPRLACPYHQTIIDLDSQVLNYFISSLITEGQHFSTVILDTVVASLSPLNEKLVFCYPSVSSIGHYVH